MGVDLETYRARIGTFISLKNTSMNNHAEAPTAQRLTKKWRSRHCTGALQADGSARPNISYAARVSGAGQIIIRTLLQKYRLDHLLAMVGGLMGLVAEIGDLLLLKSGDVEENPGPLTKGEASQAAYFNNNLFFIVARPAGFTVQC